MFGCVLYIKEVLKSTAKPNRVTWLLWSVAPLIATAAALTNGVRLPVLPVFAAGFGPLLVFIASFLNKNSYWKLGKFDYLCGFFSALALILWGTTREPNIAIVFSIASDGFAATPTLLKAWKYPETESIAPYTTGLFSALTSFAAVKTWNFSSLAFPIYLVLICALLTFSLSRQKIFKQYFTTY